MSVDPENPLLIEILSGSSTSYTYNPAEQIVDVNFFNHLILLIIYFEKHKFTFFLKSIRKQ